jgi:hypothetical protein
MVLGCLIPLLNCIHLSHPLSMMTIITEKKNSFIQPELLGFNIEVPEILPAGTFVHDKFLYNIYM